METIDKAVDETDVVKDNKRKTEQVQESAPKRRMLGGSKAKARHLKKHSYIMRGEVKCGYLVMTPFERELQG